MCCIIKKRLIFISHIIENVPDNRRILLTDQQIPKDADHPASSHFYILYLLPRINIAIKILASSQWNGMVFLTFLCFFFHSELYITSFQKLFVWMVSRCKSKLYVTRSCIKNIPCSEQILCSSSKSQKEMGKLQEIYFPYSISGGMEIGKAGKELVTVTFPIFP